MNKDTLRDAVIEAERFIKAANQVEWETMQWDWANKTKRLQPNSTGHTHAAAKRASMDLTRALAKMRRPDHER